MNDTARTASGVTPSRDARSIFGLERSLRWWSGLILFAFVAMHLLNHGLGVFGVTVLEQVQHWRTAVWRSLPGTILLYGAAAVHVALAVKRIVERRTWRMPLREALQICLGLAIPFLAYQHAIGTRWVSEVANVHDAYGATLQHLWPNRIWMQTALTLVVWGHAMIGIDYYLRTKTWWPRWREAFLVFAIVVPLMALAGFVAAGREALAIGHAGAKWTGEQVAAYDAAARFIYNCLIGFGGGLIALLVMRATARRFGRRVPVRYVGHGAVELPRGSTLLEASRENAIPHPSLCGGRARCSTCRVLVIDGSETLSAPGATEQALLDHISAPPRVRLACQIRPTHGLTVQILTPVKTRDRQTDLGGEDALATGTEVTATVLIVDMRAFTELARTQFPYDLVALLNRFMGEINQAVESHGGGATMYLSDGLMAVFGLGAADRNGARAAIRAARAMMRAIDTMNEEFQSALAIPLRVGIGIHTGPVIMARIGDDARGHRVTALGETVTIASRLEEATKRSLTDCLVSQATLHAAGRGFEAGMRTEINISGRREPVIAYALVATKSAVGDDEPAREAEPAS